MLKKTDFIKLFLIIIFVLNHTILKAESADHEVLIVKPNKSSLNQFQQYFNALRSIGLNVRTISFGEIVKLKCSSEKVLVIPGDAANILRPAEINHIIQLIKHGMNLVTDQHTALSEALGIRHKRERIIISRINDTNHSEVEIRWKDKTNAETFELDSMNVFCWEKNSKEPVLTGSQLGRGKFIFASVSFDSRNSFGYGRFPYFHESFINYFHIKPCIRRNRLVAYLDLGYHESEDLSALTKRIKSSGINEVHISSWYSFEKFGDLYKEIIQKCHENGILVYMWLEFPMVTKEFWDDHPEWREKTALLTEAALDWRKLMSFENPDCFDAVTDYLEHFISSYEWDGLDIAEFYFESLEGYKHPREFTPMSDYVRKDFASVYGFDPALIFNPGNNHYFKNNKASVNKFLDYRISLCTKLNRKFLLFLKEKGIDKKMDIYLTQIGNPANKKLNRNIGVDVSKFVELQNEFGFTMQAEDPYPLWVLGPDRYRKIGAIYRKLLNRKAILTIDINIVEEGRDDPFPTDVQTGLEFTELLNIASQSSDRVCIYAVNTPKEYDLKYASFALASSCSVVHLSSGDYKSNCIKSFILDFDSTLSSVYIDGQMWRCFDENSVIVPAGQHSIRVVLGKNSEENVPLIKDITCEIDSFKQKGNNLELSYRENRNVYITLNTLPHKIFLNKKEIKPKIYFNQEKNHYIINFPGGNNTVLFLNEK